VLFAPPEWVGALALSGVFLLLLPLNIAGLIYHRGYWQAFFIGTSPWVALIAWHALWLFEGRNPFWPRGAGSAMEMKLTLFFALCFIGLSGFSAMGVRWWAIRAQSQAVKSPPPS
jgi:hypothetical protein